MSTQEETFLCEKCLKPIPVINQTIHSLRCNPTTNSSDGLSHPHNNRNDDRGSEKLQANETLPIAQPVSAPSRPQNNNNNHQPPAPSGWTCERCTYFNENLSSHVCEVCGNSCLQIIDDSDAEVDHDEIPILPEDVIDLEPEIIHHRSPPPSSRQCTSSSQPASNLPPNTWQCQRCTLINPNRQDECSACGETRPFQQSRRERLIPDEFETHDDHPAFVFFNPNTQRQEVRPRRSNVPSSAMFGATLGAGMALLNGGSMTRGAIEGAGMGLLGGVMMDLLSEEMHHQPPPLPSSSMPRVVIRRGGGSGNPGMGFGMTPFDLLLAELSQQGGMATQPQRVREETLHQLPTHVYKAPSAPPAPSSASASSYPSTSGNDRTTCSICLSTFNTGDNLRTLPCLHHFHVQCIDRWLARSNQCPICKHTIQ